MHLNIATMISVPMVFKCGLETLEPSKDCSLPGISHELLAFVLESLNATHSLLPIRNRTASFGFKLSNISSSGDAQLVPVGMLKGLYDGKYDMIGIEYEYTSLKAEYFDYSYLVQQSPLVFLAKKPEFSFISRMIIVFKVFHWKVYLAIIVTLGAMVVGLIAAKNISNRKLFDASDIQGFIVKNLSEMYKQKVCSGKTLAVLFGFLTVLLTELYQGFLLGQLLMPPQARLFHNFDELIDGVASKKIVLVTDDENHSFFEAIRSSPVSNYQRLNAAVKMNPVQVFSDTESLLQQLHDDRYVFPCGAHRARYLLQYQCHLQQVVADGFENSWIGFLFRKDSPYLIRFNEAMIATQTYAHYLEDKYGKISEECRKVAVRAGIDPLSLLSLTGLFVMLLVGAIVGSACFLFERISSRKQQKYVVA